MSLHATGISFGDVKKTVGERLKARAAPLGGDDDTKRWGKREMLENHSK